MNHEPINTLTPREREILVMVAEGDKLQTIAEKLNRSLKTVEAHRLALGRKLNANNRVELTRIAIASGLVSIRQGGDESPENRRAGDPREELRWLNEISDRVTHVKGRDYIDALCCAMTQVFGVRFSALCISNLNKGSNERYTVAIAERGRALPSLEYQMQGTPVGLALDTGVARITDGLGASYPNDPFVAEKQLRAYLGLRVEGDFGGASCVLSVMHDKPLQAADVIERVMRFFLPRTSTELANIHKDIEIDLLRLEVANKSARTKGDASEN